MAEPVEVVVTRIAAGGDGIGRLGDGRVVFCEGALPGETVRVEVTDIRRDFARARTVEVVDPAPGRMAPPCPHLAEGCGGCTWQYVLPAVQQELKVAIVADALRRIGRLPDVEVRPAPPGRPGVPDRAYRTTARLAVDHRGRPAYRRRHARDPVAVGSCLVSHPLLEELVTGARFPGAGEVLLRVGAAGGDRLAAPDRHADRAQVPAGTGVGSEAAVHEEVGGRRWRVSARSFFQSGPDAAEALVEAVVSAAGRGDSVVDLYAGVGMLGGALVHRWGAGALVSVESDRSASADAVVNLADLDARVVAADVVDPRWRAACAPRAGSASQAGSACQAGSVSQAGSGAPAVVIADPARAGLGRPGAAVVTALRAPVVVLVSCDPAALGRDAGLLVSAGYRLEGVEVLDLFPHTFHVEAVSRFVGPG
ncbi:MAG TPA: TRAM domain-containing protein [Acidimicrobiales bacterium]